MTTDPASSKPQKPPTSSPAPSTSPGEDTRLFTRVSSAWVATGAALLLLVLINHLHSAELDEYQGPLSRSGPFSTLGNGDTNRRSGRRRSSRHRRHRPDRPVAQQRASESA